MSNLRISQKSPIVIIALFVFAAGAGIGWQLGSLLMQGETAVPMVATFQLEGSGPHDPLSAPVVFRPPYEPVRTPMLPVPQDNDGDQAQANAVTKQEEERRLADALRWAETYRQREQAAQWQAVARYQQEIQKLALAQALGVQGQRKTQEQKIAFSGVIPEAQNGSSADHRGASTGAHLTRCAGHCTVGENAKHTRVKPQLARRPQAVRRVASRPGVDAFMCPLRWLEAIAAETALMHRDWQRHYRRLAAG